MVCEVIIDEVGSFRYTRQAYLNKRVVSYFTSFQGRHNLSFAVKLKFKDSC